MDLIYVLAASLILLLALTVGEIPYSARSTSLELSPPKRRDSPSQAGRLPNSE
jgi:hypothetical protein